EAQSRLVAIFGPEHQGLAVSGPLAKQVLGVIEPCIGEPAGLAHRRASFQGRLTAALADYLRVVPQLGPEPIPMRDAPLPKPIVVVGIATTCALNEASQIGAFHLCAIGAPKNFCWRFGHDPFTCCLARLRRVRPPPCVTAPATARPGER